MAAQHHSHSTLLQAVAEVAELAGATAFEHYRQDVAVDRKGDGSPVTIADREAERRARDWIARHFPGDAVLGEEFGTEAGTTGRTWLIDPIDGTKTFVRGVPLWGSLVAVVQHAAVLAGAATFPAVGEELAAAPGEGCWHNGARCRVSEVAALAEATLLSSEIPEHPQSRQRWDALARRAGIVRTWGDCYGYLLVATGRAEAMIDPRLNPWDIACFVPIVSEAGGVLTDFSGATSWNLKDAIATNAALAAEVRRVY